MATKADVEKVGNEVVRVEDNLFQKIKNVETNLRQEIKNVETSLHQEIKSVETNLRQEMTQMENRIIIRLGTVATVLVTLATGTFAAFIKFSIK
jgi:uncharacterized membrane protein